MNGCAETLVRYRSGNSLKFTGIFDLFLSSKEHSKKLFMISFTLRWKMIPSIHLNSDSLIPKSQIDLIAGNLSIIC